jgi:ribosomal protein S18 acetylase RimI-like enzyme
LTIEPDGPRRLGSLDDAGAGWPDAAREPIVEQALIGAISSFGGLTGGSIIRDDEAIRIFSGTGIGSFNHIVRTRLADTDADRRIAAILAGFASPTVALTWWVGPNDSPAVLAERLMRLGLVQQEPEFAMILDLSSTLPRMELAVGVTLETVRDSAGIDAFLGVMAAAYAWPDPVSSSGILRQMYVPEFDRADPPANHHFLVRQDGVPVASSSLFVGGGQAFVTNIGTVPAARGRGMGRLATLATLDLARSTGYSEALLAASVDGRGLYRALGFRNCGRFDRFVASVELIAGLAATATGAGAVAPSPDPSWQPT